jgi:hypothetical protein
MARIKRSKSFDTAMQSEIAQTTAASERASFVAGKLPRIWNSVPLT